MNEKGLHIIANFYGCKNSDLLVDKTKLSELLKKSIRKNNLTILKKYFHKFGEDGGITGYVLLSESHVSIHTWPERNNYLTLDIFVCNYNKNNIPNAKNIFRELISAFNPEKTEKKLIRRH
ncbi:MAG: adenosylmethionine decarboxylase [archaeon]